MPRAAWASSTSAEDTELHREVALKEIQESHADEPPSRARFVAEAEITGGLEHPGIVPVYGLGTYADGRPYYAMRFIQGDSLKDAIAGFHRDEQPGRDPGERALGLQKLLRRFLDVCNAVEYAHSRGVLHRDLKPGNIMIGKYGETLVVDWGLAKAVDGPAAPDPGGEPAIRPSSGSGRGSGAETLPGQAIGTPQFMSPEQAAGRLDLLGTRSDVYSLGATLYQLLTGRPPFAGYDAGEVLRRVQEGEFPPPRRVNPQVPPLDAVCRKAMALKSEDRYASAKAMAEEVEHWLADEPVSAYTEGLAPRLARWARRHRTAVIGGAVTAVATVVVLAGGLVLTERARRQTSVERESGPTRPRLTRSARRSMVST